MAGFKLLRIPLACLIAANTAIFLLFGLIGMLTDVHPALYFAMTGPADVWIYQPWGLLTYMFVQTDVLHLIFNMMWLWAFGALMVRLEGNRSMVTTYLVSGIAGGICFLVTSTIALKAPALLIGSSAAVLGIIAGSAAMQPRLQLNLILFGNVELRWVALVAILICGIAPGLGATPTLVAHIGGAVAGWVYIRLRAYTPKTLRAQHDKSYRYFNVRQHERKGLNNREQAELDTLLDKVKASGFKSLSMKDRNRLFQLSNKINK